ncbi:MAG: cytochrome P450 [Myxococcota bacterium]
MEAVADPSTLPAPHTPSPPELPLLGSLLPLARDPLGFVVDLARTHGDVVHYRVGPQRFWLVSDPAGIEEVLVGLRAVTHKDEVTHGLSRLLGQGLLTSEDPQWRQHRKLAAPSFQPRHLAGYAEAMVDAALEDPLADGARDVHEDMTRVTMAIVLRTLFGADAADGARVGAALGSFMDAFEQEIRSFRRLLPPRVPTRGRRRIAAARAEIVAAVDPIVARRRALPEPGDDLLGRLLAARDEDGAGMSDAQLRDEAVTLFLAGHETTALTLSYALWLLAAHPEVQDRLAEERATVLGERRAGAGDVGALAWHGAVIREAMRLYPPAWLIGRTPTVDVTVQGHPVPAGGAILVSPWVTHRDPRFWRAPEAFRPERWLGDETRDLPRFAFFPFGGGPRVCIGNHFAQMEAVLVLATWLAQRRVAAVPGATIELMPAVTLRPRHGVRVDVQKIG